MHTTEHNVKVLEGNCSPVNEAILIATITIGPYWCRVVHNPHATARQSIFSRSGLEVRVLRPSRKTNRTATRDETK